MLSFTPSRGKVLFCKADVGGCKRLTGDCGGLDISDVLTESVDLER